MTALLRPVTKTRCSMPAALASSATCWTTGRSTTVSISFGTALVAGRKRVPRPATGRTALRMRFMTGWAVRVGSERAVSGIGSTAQCPAGYAPVKLTLFAPRSSSRFPRPEPSRKPKRSECGVAGDGDGGAEMAVLVTGGAGYIGSHMVLELLDAGEDVVVLDDLSTGLRWSVPDGVPLVVADMGDEAAVGRVIAEHGIDAIAHFAARIVVPESVSDPLGYYLNNTVKSRALLATAVA